MSNLTSLETLVRRDQATDGLFPPLSHEKELEFQIGHGPQNTYRRNDIYAAGLAAASTGQFEHDESYASESSTRVKEKYAAPVATVIQLWEGKVLKIDTQTRIMHVLLTPKLGKDQPHIGDIDLQWVPEQDVDLVVPGAIFYLTLFKRTKRGGIENAQELRFRRLPSWSRKQIERVEKDAEMILSKMRPRPTME